MNPNKDHMPSILLILPYFGPLPSYAELFFRSCAANPTINWLLITDQQLEDHCLPGNVAVRKTSFGELKKRIDKTLGMETTLATPYKLCDFKPAYGAIFADEIVPYDFWGYCDMDVIFGNIRALNMNCTDGLAPGTRKYRRTAIRPGSAPSFTEAINPQGFCNSREIASTTLGLTNKAFRRLRSVKSPFRIRRASCSEIRSLKRKKIPYLEGTSRPGGRRFGTSRTDLSSALQTGFHSSPCKITIACISRRGADLE